MEYTQDQILQAQNYMNSPEGRNHNLHQIKKNIEESVKPDIRIPQNTGYSRLQEIQSELERQTSITVEQQYQLQKLNAQLQVANKIIDEQIDQLNTTNELNNKLTVEVDLFRKQLYESKMVKFKRIIVDIIIGIISGVVTALIINFIT